MLLINTLSTNTLLSHVPFASLSVVPIFWVALECRMDVSLNACCQKSEKSMFLSRSHQQPDYASRTVLQSIPKQFPQIAPGLFTADSLQYVSTKPAPVVMQYFRHAYKAPKCLPKHFAVTLSYVYTESDGSPRFTELHIC